MSLSAAATASFRPLVSEARRIRNHNRRRLNSADTTVNRRQLLPYNVVAGSTIPATFFNRLVLNPVAFRNIPSQALRWVCRRLKLRAHLLNLLVLLFETRSKSFQSLALLSVDCFLIRNSRLQLVILFANALMATIMIPAMSPLLMVFGVPTVPMASCPNAS